MATRPINSSSLISLPRLLVEDISIGVRSAGARLTQASTGSTHQPDALVEIKRLIELMRDRTLTALERGATTESKSQRQNVDRALAKISELLGSRLLLGGKQNAILEGLNPNQIVGYTIQSLRPNANAEFSGSLDRKQRAARVSIADMQGLLATGGSLLLNAGSAKQSIPIRSGSSLNSLVRRINRLSNLGASARNSRGVLEITTDKRGHEVSLNVVTNPHLASGGLGPPQIAGINGAQVASIGTSGLTAGVPVSITGSHDSLATAAELTYQGSAGAVASGAATFRLTGAIGSANLNIVQGESLADFTQRINDASANTGIEAEQLGNNVTLRSLSQGASAAVAIDNVAPESTITVTGVNSSQVNPFNVLSIPDETQIALTGTVTQAADSAEQTYHGAAGGQVVDSATFTLTGSLGAVPIGITQGESLSDVAQRINDETPTTGVSATTSGDDLVFQSVAVGSSENVQVTLVSVSQTIDVAGVNASQITDFQVLTAQPDSTNLLNGTVSQAATRGELTYTGVLGATTSSANVTLSGELGSAVYSIGALQSLTSVRDTINTDSATTGVTAAVTGNTLTLSSTGFGSAAIVEVGVNSGTFNTTGGDGSGNAAGLDAELVINGNSVTASGNDVAYADALGSYTWTLAEGFIGTLDAVTVSSTNGNFDVSGGDVTGTSYGTDAAATINSQSFVAGGNDFTLNIDGAQFSMLLTAGFSGALDPITVDSSYQDFTITGGNGDSTASGQDGSATINGQSLTSSNESYDVVTAGGTANILFQELFLGQFDDINITYATTAATGIDGTTYSARGSDAKLVVDGEQKAFVQGEYVLQRNGVVVALQFAKNFQGAFDPFTVSAGGAIDTVTATPALTGSLRTSVRSALTELFTLASGGENADLDHLPGSVLAFSSDALDSLRTIEGTSVRLGRRSLTGSLFDRSV